MPGSNRPQRGATTPRATKKIDVSEVDGKISYEISITKKTGDFEFIKLTAGIEVPNTATDDEIKAVAERMVVVRDAVVERLEADFDIINI